MSVITATDADFATKVSEHPVTVVKYFATWCGSCRLIAPKFEKLSNDEQFKDVAFLEVDAEANPDTRKLAGVSNLPYFAIFKHGQLVEGDFTAKIDSVSEMIQRAQQN
jgi:thiol-disulfide isomerase/thioredoxin